MLLIKANALPQAHGIEQTPEEQQYQCAVRRLGSSFIGSPSLIDDLEQLICKIFGYPRINKVAEVSKVGLIMLLLLCITHVHMR